MRSRSEVVGFGGRLARIEQVGRDQRVVALDLLTRLVVEERVDDAPRVEPEERDAGADLDLLEPADARPLGERDLVADEAVLADEVERRCRRWPRR